MNVEMEKRALGERVLALEGQVEELQKQLGRFPAQTWQNATKRCIGQGQDGLGISFHPKLGALLGAVCDPTVSAPEGHGQSYPGVFGLDGHGGIEPVEVAPLAGVGFKVLPHQFTEHCGQSVVFRIWREVDRVEGLCRVVTWRHAGPL